MTPLDDPDAVLDARLTALFTARAELAAARAPSVDDAAAELDRRIHGHAYIGGGRGRAAWPGLRFYAVDPRSTAGRPVSADPRLAATVAALLVVLALVVASLVGGAGRPPSPTPGVPSTLPSAVPSSPALFAPTGYPGAGVIEFTRPNASGGSDLWLIDPAGTNERLLVPGGCCGLFSPDGRQLAAAVPGGGLIPAGSSLLGVNVYPQPGASVGSTLPAGCGACGIMTSNSAPFAWSPDGVQVAVNAWSGSGSDLTQGVMLIAAAPNWTWGTGALGPNAESGDIPIAFSPDGTLLLYLRVRQTTGGLASGPLYLLTIAQRSARRLTPPGMTVSTSGLTRGFASWSPDGTKIAFAATDATSGASRIYVTGPSAGAKVIAVVPAGGATSAAFSPDGTWIAYDAAAPGGLHDLHVVHPDGTGDRVLTGGFGPGVCCGQWSPDGTAVLVAGTSSDDLHADLFIVTLAGDVRQVTQRPDAYADFGWGRQTP